MSLFSELADRCEQANAEQQRDLLIEAHLLARGMARHVRREYAATLDNNGFLDAALTLVPNELDWTLDWLGERSAAWILAARFKTSGAAMTPALALCAAALRAREVAESETHKPSPDHPSEIPVE